MVQTVSEGIMWSRDCEIGVEISPKPLDNQVPLPNRQIAIEITNKKRSSK
jgi:hypothetical protein